MVSVNVGGEPDAPEIENSSDSLKATSNLEPTRSRRASEKIRKVERIESRHRQIVRLPDETGGIEVKKGSEFQKLNVDPQVIEFKIVQFPEREIKRSYAIRISFFVFVLLPSLIGVWYFLFFASDQFAAEFKFSVSDASAASSGTMATSIAAAVSGGASATSGSTSNYMVTDYVLSSAAIAELEKRLRLRSLYEKESIDWWSRFGRGKTSEQFLDYWRSVVRSDYDQVTGLALVEVRAFSSEDAFEIADNLVDMAEILVNDIARRPLMDAVRVAEGEVSHTQEKLKSIRATMTEYRNAEAVIDPSISLTNSNSLLVQSLRQSITVAKTDFDTLQIQHVSPSSPVFQSAQVRLNALVKQLTAVEHEVVDRGGSTALSKVVGEYEQLDMERQFAVTSLASAQAALDAARANLVAQRMFITPYIRPVRPTSAIYPKRWLSIAELITFLVLMWASGVLIVRSLGDVRS